MQNRGEFIAKKQSGIKLTIILLSVLVLLGVFGSTLAWFTNSETLKGGGSTPNVSVSLYANNTLIGSDASESYSQTNPSLAYTETVENSFQTTYPVEVSFTGSNIDVLLVATVAVNFLDGGNLVPSAGWCELNINASNWTKGDDGKYYYNTKITSANASNKVKIFDIITITDASASGKTLEIIVFIEAVQANQAGLDKLTENGNSILPQSFINLI